MSVFVSLRVCVCEFVCVQCGGSLEAVVLAGQGICLATCDELETVAIYDDSLTGLESRSA